MFLFLGSNATSYNGLTAHWLNLKTYEHESRLIDVSEFKVNHTAENLKKDYNRNIQKYGLDTVLTCTDSAENIKKAMKENMKETGIIWISCFGHDNNLIFVYGYKRTQAIIDLRQKLSDFVTVTKKSNNAKMFLIECEIAVGILNALMLIQMTDTRWNR